MDCVCRKPSTCFVAVRVHSGNSTRVQMQRRFNGVKISCSGTPRALLWGKHSAVLYAVAIFEVLENLCTALQGREATVTGMLEAVNKTISTLTALRSGDNFAVLYQRAEEAASECQMNAISLARQMRSPKNDLTHVAAISTCLRHQLHSLDQFMSRLFIPLSRVCSQGLTSTVLQSLNSWRSACWRAK